MGLNISKGNMYEFITHTWNTVKGECPHNCSYCYMKRWGRQNKIRFDETELNTDLGSGNFVFIGSGCDMFANEIPEKWIKKTLAHANAFSNTYLFQTKNPWRFWNFISAGDINIPKRSVFCTTMETNRWYPNIMGNAPTPFNRSINALNISTVMPVYVTVEPIMDFDVETFATRILAASPRQVNIGSDSGNNNLPEPSPPKVLELIEYLENITYVEKKKNLKRLL